MRKTHTSPSSQIPSNRHLEKKQEHRISALQAEVKNDIQKAFQTSHLQSAPDIDYNQWLDAKVIELHLTFETAMTVGMSSKLVTVSMF